MNRHLLALLLVLVMCVFCACGKSTNIPGVEPEPEDWGDAPVEDVKNHNTDAFGATTGDTDMSAVDIDAEDAQNSEIPSTSEATIPGATEETEATAVPLTDYEWYHSLSGEEQEAYMDSFESVAAFFDWYNAAKAEYDALHPEIEIDDNVIDLGDLVGGNG